MRDGARFRAEIRPEIPSRQHTPTGPIPIVMISQIAGQSPGPSSPRHLAQIFRERTFAVQLSRKAISEGRAKSVSVLGSGTEGVGVPTVP
jgi:hypothetical protein